MREKELERMIDDLKGQGMFLQYDPFEMPTELKGKGILIARVFLEQESDI